MGRRAKRKAARGTKRAKAAERDTVSVRRVRMGLVVKWAKAHVKEQARRREIFWEAVNCWKHRKSSAEDESRLPITNIQEHLAGRLEGDCYKTMNLQSENKRTKLFVML